MEINLQEVYMITLSGNDLMVIQEALIKLPYEIVSPVIETLKHNTLPVPVPKPNKNS